MLNRYSLDPEHRTLYGTSLRPPPGYVFDAAVATTYSLDFETALAVPVTLALFAAENRDEILTHPLALLEGAEHIAGQLLIFMDAGHIQAQTRPHSRLCALLERIIVEAAPLGDGVFHPKMWALRYTPVRPEDPIRLRLLILSRNLTRDRSWDIALVLDGIVENQPKAVNRPLADFIRRLPGLATVGTPAGTPGLVDTLAKDIRRTAWTLPEPFESIAFAVNGLGGKPWMPDACTKLGIISSFCDDQTLLRLADLVPKQPPVLIGRSDELAGLAGATLDRFSRVAVLDEMAISEDGEEADAASMQGLHAKVFIAERGWDTTITMGSGNATRPALLTSQNVELFATLTGKRSKVGSVEDITGATGFGRLTRPFDRREPVRGNAAQLAAEVRLEKARREICRAGVRLRCERATPADDGTALWHLCLEPRAPLVLAGLGAMHLWPITRGDGHACAALAPLRHGAPVDLGAMPLEDLTRFIACHLTDETENMSLLFSTGFAVDGLPEERHGAILRSVINSKAAFFQYLRLLLAELDDPFAAALAAQDGGGNGVWRLATDAAPILEDMVRAFCCRGEQLGAIDRLIERLEAAGGGSTDAIPAEFRTLWNTFRMALDAQETAHGR